ncbi:MAG: hypothetical protein KGI70_01485, partial [Patescibacteria group bacterium]|nr:hypothetical protein [Patescibacteria group bacterium]
MAATQGSTTQRSGLYNRFNTPPSTDAARQRLGEVESVVTLIELQLKTEKPYEWASEDEFNSWHNAAVKACAGFQTEKNFIEKWLSAQTQPHIAKKIFAVSEAHRLSAREILQQDIADAAHRLEEKLEPLASMSAASLGVVEKELRARELTKLLKEVGRALGEANNRAQTLYVGKASLPELRKPLTVLQGKIRDVLYPQGQEKFGDFLMRLVERAVQKGFQLTPEESAQV